MAQKPFFEWLNEENEKQTAVKNASVLDRLKDIGIDATDMALSLPEQAIGLADIPTGGHVGKFLEGDKDSFINKLGKGAVEAIGEKIWGPINNSERERFLKEDVPVGINIQKAREAISGGYSAERMAEEEAVARAGARGGLEGFGGALALAVANPAVAAASIIKSAPSMYAGGLIAGRVAKAAPALPKIAAYLAGEGALSAGSNEESIRYETPDRLTTAKQSGLALASGALTGALTAASGGLSKKLKIGDIDLLMDGAKLSKKTAEEVSKQTIRQKAPRRRHH